MEIDRAGLERFERDLPLAVVFEAQPAEIVLADVDRQVLGPIVVAQLVFDRPPLLEGLDPVGAGAERRIERRSVEVAPLPPRGGKDRHAGDDEMGVARALFDEAHQHDVVGLGVDAVDFDQQLRIGRVRLLLEHVERELDVGRRHRRAVGEARLGAQLEAVAELVGADSDRARQQAVERIRLVAVAAHQRVEHCRHARRAVAALGEDVERVEGVEVLVARGRGDLQRQQAALRRVGIDVGEALEIGRQGEVAKRGQAMRFEASRRPAPVRRRRCQGGERRRTLQCAAPGDCRNHAARFPVRLPIQAIRTD